MSAFIPPPIPKTKIEVVPRCTCTNCQRATYQAGQREPAESDLERTGRVVLFLMFLALVALLGMALIANPWGGFP